MKSLLLLALFCLAGCTASDVRRAEIVPLDTARIAADLRYLTSDELAGREATTPSEILASDYLASELKKAGVEPYLQSYFEPFAVNASRHDTTSAIEILSGRKEASQWAFGKQFYVGDSPARAIDTTTGIVFAGYGITAPEFHYDDYQNLDVRGKTVILLAGEPKSDSANYFNGPAVSKYSSLNEKSANARRHGARALITSSLMLRRLGWKAGQRFYNGEDLELPDRNPPVSKTEENPAFATVITSDSIIRGMFGGETHSFDELELADTTGRPMPTFPLHSSIHLVLKPARVTEKHCRNVVGVIEGNDPALRSEFVAIGAHYDHLGKRNGEIYHGADDDGSGTVGVLEAARALARTRANKRSILIVFHAAEEKGLFGSEYLTSHLPGLECVDLQVNLDMIGRENPDSIYSIGSERLSSELRGMIEKVNDDGVKMRLNYSYDARNDPNRFYFRSDHYNYAKHGIPIVFFFDDMRADYHRPTDTIEKINFEKIRKVAALASGIIEEAANLNQKLRVDRNGE